MALLALTFFLFGYIVHQPTVVQIRNRLASATGLVTPSQTTLSVPVSESANRALRVRVLNELLKERYPSG
jgi:hypothetical protein